MPRDAVEPARQPGPGGRLARVRVERGIALDDVVAFLKYAPRQIEALEADHYDLLPPAAVVRGMVRGYARFLNLDAEPLLEDLRRVLSGPPPAVSAPVMDVPFQTRRRAAWIWWLVSGLIAVAVVAFVIDYFLRDAGWLKSRAPEARPAAAVGPGEARPGETRRLDESHRLDESGRPDDPPARSATPAQPSGDVPARAETAVPAVSSNSQLRVHCEKRSWVEVKAGDGTVLVNQMLDAGSDRTFEGRPPFSVVIGAAHSVSLSYNGERINLAPYTVVDVARLSLK